MNQQLAIAKVDNNLRTNMASATWRSERDLHEQMQKELNLDQAAWNRIAEASTLLIEQLRHSQNRPLIDQFLTEYGLSSEEGVQLMRLAEALSRTTNATTADELIQDKLIGRDWLSHSGAGHTLAMSLSGRILDLTDRWLHWNKSASNPLTKLIAKIGNVKLRFGIRTAIKVLSSQFVFAETLDSAIRRGEKYSRKGYVFSFDMLGEAARTATDAQKYHKSYADALDRVAAHAKSDDPGRNHSISIKLSALHPRYEFAQAERAVPEIAAMLLPLAIKARAANIQITIDAEETERLDISMDVLATLVAAPELKGWKGLGFVVQAYQRRALPLIDWLAEQAVRLEAPLFIRLVKGAYWDSEIKRAQEMGLDSYPVFTRKEMTDLSYLTCAQKLLASPDHYVPQFATHNAHSIAAVKELAGPERPIEIQRLFGMGQELHDGLLDQPQILSRIYAPVGTQKDLLSYLIRRLLENGANSSFVHKLADPNIKLSTLVRDPITALEQHSTIANQRIPPPKQYLSSARKTAKGWDLANPMHRMRFQEELNIAAKQTYLSAPIIAGEEVQGDEAPVFNPAITSEQIGSVVVADENAAEIAIVTAQEAFASWSCRSAAERARLLENAADLLEERSGLFHYLAIKEAGKTWSDAIDEVREAVDFCRYYAEQAKAPSFSKRHPLGVTICISPWNFPLAIFLGQITAALAAGNTVVAKPAEQTPLIAAEAIRLLHDAGIDAAAVNLLPGSGALIGEALVSHSLAAAVCFTGSTATAKRITRRLAQVHRPLTPLIAETGGINAMIVDSSALPEQTVDAVISSAFQSAGQRCSALRILCIQEDIADQFIELLCGAMQALEVGDPWHISNDVGPVIDAAAKQNITSHVNRLDEIGRKIGSTSDLNVEDGQPNTGNFVFPVAYELNDISDLDREIFGPVLHVVRFKADEKMAVIDKINNSGFGLTLGIHSRIDGLSQDMAERAQVGNIYINRNQIGAVVGVQPFGGQGLSGTGPKAGGPLYLLRLSKSERLDENMMVKESITGPMGHQHVPSVNLADSIAAGIKSHDQWSAGSADDNGPTLLTEAAPDNFGQILSRELSLRDEILTTNISLASPAGETNVYDIKGRGLIVSMLQDKTAIFTACARALVTGNSFLQIDLQQSNGNMEQLINAIDKITGIDNLVQQSVTSEPEDIFRQLQAGSIGGIIVDPTDPAMMGLGAAIAERNGAILPILTLQDSHDRFVHEKTVTCNTAASGGDVSLLNA